MNFSPKQKAVVATIGVFAVAVITGNVIRFIAENVSFQVISYAVGFGVLASLAYIMYQILLAKFEYEDSLKKMVDHK